MHTAEHLDKEELLTMYVQPFNY